MKALETVFSREDMPFEEAVSYFSSRLTLAAADYYKLSEEYRALAFTVSGFGNLRILNVFYDELLHALEEGRTLYDFRQSVDGFLNREGYEGLDPLQADNIFRTNIQSAYQAGHYEQMTQPEILRLRPYWQYEAVEDDSTRPEHLAMDGRVYPADSPVWDQWFPPNGFRCRCTVSSLSEREVKARGLAVETEAPRGALRRDGSAAPLLPDASFAHNPAKARHSPELSAYPEALQKAYRAREDTKAT